MEGNNNETAEKEAKPSCCVRFRTSMHNAGRFMYNSDTKEIMGRRGVSWLKVLCFYFVFYCMLAGFWAACMVAFIRTLDPVVPTMQKMFSMMKDNPGMSYEPFIINTSATLINFNHTNTTTYDVYFQRLATIYSKGENDSTSSKYPLKSCSLYDGATPDIPCRFDMRTLGDNCTEMNKFGYNIGRPCVLLRINKVFLWEPNNVTFDYADKCSSPVDKTKDECKNQIDFLAIRPEVRSDIQPGFISVSCEGENDGDRDNIKSVTFYPSGGFPAYFYPYFNQDGYMSPLVMAQFDVVPGRVSLILCQIWTRDVIHDKNDLQGSVHFELFVDP